MPAATIVAAWISAEAGVGPSMASGSQSWNGSWADLPATPKRRAEQRAQVRVGRTRAAAPADVAARPGEHGGGPWPTTR